MLRALAWLLWVGGLAACAAVPPLPPADPAPRSHAVRVVRTGEHTAIVIARAEVIATGLLPEAEDVRAAAYLEFGWGDRVYYPTPEPTLGMTLDAAFWPTPAVMHLAARARPPELTYAGVAAAEVEVLAMTQGNFRRLVGAIADEFLRPESGRAEPIARNLVSGGYFYEAHGRFHLFNTCNTWTARMLRAGGVNLWPSGVVTGNDLMTRLRAALAEDRASRGRAALDALRPSAALRGAGAGEVSCDAGTFADTASGARDGKGFHAVSKPGLDTPGRSRGPQLICVMSRRWRPR